MALSKEFLKEFELTQGNVVFLMNKKQDLTRDKNTAFRAFAKYLGISNVPQRERGHGAKSCCGTRELQGLEDVEEQRIKRAVVGSILCAWRTMVYYTTSPSTRRILKQIGFEEIDSFENDNTGHTVHVMWLNVME